MPDLTGYPAHLLPLPPRVSNFIDLVEHHGFKVKTTEQVKTHDETRQTLVVNWKGERVGYMKHDMWNNDGPIMGYHFNPWLTRGQGRGDGCPKDFSQEAFCKQHGISPDSFELRFNDRHNYLRARDEATALKLLQDSAARLTAAGIVTQRDEDEWLLDRDHDEVADDIAQVAAREDLTPTQKKRLTDARVGQGRYRRELEQLFGGCCAVTQLKVREALRASHALAWSESDDRQRLDPNNGLLLTANLDALFDKHLITFDRKGKLRTSRRISSTDRQILRELDDLQREPTPQQWAYLQRHNQTFDELEFGGGE